MSFISFNAFKRYQMDFTDSDYARKNYIYFFGFLIGTLEKILAFTIPRKFSSQHDRNINS